MKAALVLFIALGLPVLATADVVVPIVSVQQFVNIRAEPTAESYVIGRLYQGDNVLLVKPGTGWHEIQIEPGLNGYISSDWATVFADADAAAAAAAVAAAAAAEMAEALEPVPEPSPEEVFEEALAEEIFVDQSSSEPVVEAE